MKSGCPHLDLGAYEWSPRLSFPNSSSHESFKAGLVQLWGFNHEDSLAHFGDCLAALSSSGAPCLKVVVSLLSAFCLSPNYNNPMGLSVEKASNFISSAQEIAKGTDLPAWVVAFLGAAEKRVLPLDETTANRNLAYATAMTELIEGFSDLPPDVYILHMESIMNKRPWKLWPTFKERREAREQGNPPPAIHPETQTLEKLFCQYLNDTTWGKSHPGLLHLNIHFWELSPTPEKGIIAADLLTNLFPDQGHLQHMPSHIHMWMGMYDEAIRANVNAVRADDKYVNLSGGSAFYTFYRIHNIHFVMWAAMFAGQEALALEYGKRLENEAGNLYLNKENSCFLEGFSPMVWYVYIRFGRWEQILDRAIPEGEMALMGKTVAYYAKGMAAASLGRVEEAEEYEQKMLECLKNEEIWGYEKRAMHNNAGYIPPHLLKTNPAMPVGLMNVGEAVLRGEILYRKGEFAQAFEELRKAVELDDLLVYDEPWGWMVPARHALGALLAEQGELDEAIYVFETDLQKMPQNIWGLVGLRDALRKRGGARDLDRADLLGREVMLRGRGAGVKMPQAACACAVVAGAAEPKKGGCCRK